ncbi:hypothetical protein PybrP1_003138 [[Pythium] brassicae (nom. inval.)]|nr:hypothetical protein PybrP1_003138 [[Pythium] brassicae (nom. inval.)]
MRRRVASSARECDAPPPPGWTRILPSQHAGGTGAASPGTTRGPDALGLSRALAPAALLRRELRVREQLHVAAASKDVSPRHRKLSNQQRVMPGHDINPREAFSPQHSLRLTTLQRPTLSRDEEERRVAPTSPSASADRAELGAGAREQHLRGGAAPDLPLHELIRTVDDGVAADPFADSSQAAITDAFMAQWLARYDANRHQYKSVAVHAEVGFQELNRLTANVPRPNELATAFACNALRDLAPHFGAYTPLLNVLRAELQLSVYSPASSPPLPYFTLVKRQKQLVLALRRDKARRRERNAFLAREIATVHRVFHHFLDACSAGLVRTLFREWYSIAVVRKKNSKKYIEYFSMWFTGSAKSLVPKLFATWKHKTVQRKMSKMQAQLRADAETLAALQQQIDDLALQRDVAQLESLAIRNDRKQAEDTIQRLNRKVESAGAYLEGSYRREGLVCVEGQLRVEAVSFLPPLVLESLLRAYHSVGFLQQVHSEFVPKPTAATPVVSLLRQASNATISFGDENAAAAISPLATVDSAQPSSAPLPAPSSASTEISLRSFAQQFRSVQQRMGAKHLFVIFTGSLPAVPVPRARDATEGDEDETDKSEDEQDDSTSAAGSPSRMHATAQEIKCVYEHTIRAIRAQDEHYARNAKLFSSRMLESHEVSVAPTHYIARSGSILATATAAAVSIPSNAALDRIEMLQEGDFDMSARHSRAFSMVFLAHLVTEFGSLLFSPADMSPFMHSAYLCESPAPAVGANESVAAAKMTSSTTCQDSEQGFHDVVLAYEAWNRLAGQMIEADIVQNRGGSLVVPENALAADLAETAARPAPTPSGLKQPTRPKLQFHIEPLPQGILMTCAKEKDAVVGSGAPQRPSLVVGETFHSARIRRLASHDAATLTQCVESIHSVVKTTSSHLQDFNTMRRQLSEFRHLQWEQASELAGQFVSSSSVASSSSSLSAQATAADSTAPIVPVISVFSPPCSHLVDERKHIFECVSFDNPVIERIFSVEESPLDELERVRAIFERKAQLVRHLYTKHRPQIHHAVSLDDLWHFVKVLRLPKEIHMLPAMRDDDNAAASGFEQLFSPDDLAEILLHLCNEQFLPQLAPISARVEYFVAHHLPFAAQNQSLIRDVMHQQDVKRALADHAQTIRVIFRRYCAKERDVGAVHAQQQHHHHHMLLGGASAAATGKTATHQHAHGHRTGRHIGHGIARFMRLIDWLAFIQDYNLLRPRFPLDYAVTVFRNVQEVASSNGPGDDAAATAAAAREDEQHLEMIYSEFCEALVSVAACFFPDPFVKSATKVSQFVQRFLPVSPEEVRPTP